MGQGPLHNACRLKKKGERDAKLGALPPSPSGRRRRAAPAGAGALNNSWKLNCFPFAGRKVICGDDQSGFAFIVDVDTRRVSTMPPLPRRMPTASPVSVFVHKPDVDAGSSLFVMERVPRLEPISNEAPVSEQFVGFVNHYPSGLCGDKCFTGRLLPPPPFVRETWSWYNNTPEITACGVVGVGGGSQHLCIYH